MVPSCWRATGERRNLIELVAAAEHALILWHLRRGAHDLAIAELERLVTTEPLRERHWELLMTALARSGRRSDALAAYQRARSILVTETGLEPGDALRRIEAAVLEGTTPTTGADRRDHIPIGAQAGQARTPVRPILPRFPNPLIGRQSDIHQLVQALSCSPLVTLVGPGGIGKTRLAIEVAQQCAASFPDGIWFCDLSTISDGNAVAPAVAAALEVRQNDPRRLVEAITAVLRDARALLVLDNCEHVVEAAAPLAAAIVELCHSTTLIATSRVRLGISSERLQEVGMLELPAAIRLFEHRSTLAGHDRLLEQHRGTVEAICRKLDGVPLALELAAARLRVVDVEHLLSLLDNHLGTLRNTERNVHRRHRTLQATMTWSYALLPAQASGTLDRLSIFAGSFDLPAVTAICDNLDGNPRTALDAIEDLVEHSMLVVQDGDHPYRYRLLETVRQFAADRLRQSGLYDRIAANHFAYFNQIAQSARLDYETHEPLQAVATYRKVWDDLRLAFRWAASTKRAAQTRELLESIAWYGYFSLITEVGAWAEAALSADIEDTTVLGIAACFAHLAGEHAKSIELAERAVELAPYPTHPSTHWSHWAAVVAHTHSGNLGPVEALEDGVCRACW